MARRIEALEEAMDHAWKGMSKEDRRACDAVSEALQALRRRVRLTDDDIRAAGLGDPDVAEESAAMVAWIERRPDLSIRPLVGILHAPSDGEPSLIRAGPIACPWIINRIADALGSAPLDILAEIAGNR